MKSQAPTFPRCSRGIPLQRDAKRWSLLRVLIAGLRSFIARRLSKWEDAGELENCAYFLNSDGVVYVRVRS